MTTPNTNRGLADVAEAAGITRLLAEVTRRPTRPPAPPPPPPAAVAVPPEFPFEPPAHVPAASGPDPLDDTPVGELFAQANWRNQPPPEREAGPPPFPAAVTPEPLAPSLAEVPAGPDYVPIGTLAVAELFALVNWRNRPDGVRPLPIIEPDRPPGYEWTVEAVMAAFFGD
jgi:hypothetical protein